MVAQLQEVLDDLDRGIYERKMVEGTTKLSSEYKPGQGKIIYDKEDIKFENVPIITPNGDLLIDRVSFEVKAGMNLMIVGPNGSGKSSLFRILGELWPLFGGTLTKPSLDHLFYIPQKPYLVVGTLRDQVIYPHTLDDMKAAGFNDQALLELLDLVQLKYIVEREVRGFYCFVLLFCFVFCFCVFVFCVLLFCVFVFFCF